MCLKKAQDLAPTNATPYLSALMDDYSDRLKAALAEHYAIERELGAGGVATVYLAQDLKHHRKVAVRDYPPFQEFIRPKG